MAAADLAAASVAVVAVVVAVVAGKPRHTARGIVVRDDQLLLMERWRQGHHYFSIPGGGIEHGELGPETAVREIAEETSIVVQSERQVLQMNDDEVVHQIYLCKYLHGEPFLPHTSPEYLHDSDDNIFQPIWVAIADLPQLPLIYWEPLREPLILGLQNGFGKEVVIVSAGAAR